MEFLEEFAPESKSKEIAKHYGHEKTHNGVDDPPSVGDAVIGIVGQYALQMDRFMVQVHLQNDNKTEENKLPN